MSLAIVYCRANSGMTSPLVTAEIHIANGNPYLGIVGLPETVVKESKDRVRSAIITTRFDLPMRRMIVNLAPAELPKDGGRFDLPIALGILAASRQIPLQRLAECEFIGELALSGELRPVTGILSAVLATQKAGRLLIIPKENAAEAALAKSDHVLVASNLVEVCAYLKGQAQLQPCTLSETFPISMPEIDMAEIKGQPQAKRALEITAAGRHSLLLVGPPGTGKTMLASRLTTVLPELNDEESLEVATVLSTNWSFNPQKWRQIPFRSPHHSASSVALVGGGRPPRPGEITLAHRGVLFLDELPEFGRGVLESLREPLESGMITISRAAHQTVFPARFQLIAAMNPCPCGYLGDIYHACRCSPESIQRYQARLSGPLLDRIDMHLEVPTVPTSVLLSSKEEGEKSEVIRERVVAARLIQFQRQGKCNAELNTGELKEVCQLDAAAQKMLEGVMQKYHFSARVYHRILKLALTIADLKKVSILGVSEISEALLYRVLDKQKRML